MGERRLFERSGDIIETLEKGKAYFLDISNGANDDMVMPCGNRLVRKIEELSAGLQNGHSDSEKGKLVRECVAEVDNFRTSVYGYQQRMQNNLYDKSRRAFDEFHTAIVMYKVKHNLC